jgi:hypothetical protein
VAHRGGIDWGGKVAAWFAGVAAVAAALATLIVTTTKALHSWLQVLFVALVIIAIVAFVALLFTGIRALYESWRGRHVPPTPMKVQIWCEPSNGQLYLIVSNPPAAGAEGEEARFRANVIRYFDEQGARPKRQTWPIPWLDGKTGAKAIPAGDKGVFDLARFYWHEQDLRTTKWGDHEDWSFPSVPGPIKVRYSPMATLDQAADRRLRLDVRVVRDHPSGITEKTINFGFKLTTNGYAEVFCD